LRDDIYLPTTTNFTQLSGTTLLSGACSDTGGKLKYWVRRNCKNNTFRCTGASTDSGCSYSVTTTSGSSTQSGCQWSLTASDGTVSSDCCESNCGATSPAPCWTCVYDLQETGEKVINKPLIAGGVVFFTSFVPISSASDVCGVGGSGYLYAFDYMCQAFPEGFNPIPSGTNMITLTSTSSTSSSSSSSITGVRVDLGLGVPSQPVLDSSGKYVIVQTSSGQLSRIGVNLLTPPTSLKGWKENN
jgi:type IV pilus assembly protein PilY1